MRIPVTRNLSTEINDCVGYLDIPKEMADSIAACYAKGLGFKIDACVQKDGDTCRLMHVSISSIPVETARQNGKNRAQTELKRKK